MTDEIDLERIFIGRKDQLRKINTEVQAWRSRLASSEGRSDADGSRRCIILLSGGGGLGKSTLLRHCHEELAVSEPFLRRGEIIDWSYLHQSECHSPYFIASNMDELAYLEAMHQQLAPAIHGRLLDFKEYERQLAIIREIE